MSSKFLMSGCRIPLFAGVAVLIAGFCLANDDEDRDRKRKKRKRKRKKKGKKKGKKGKQGKHDRHGSHRLVWAR